MLHQVTSLLFPVWGRLVTWIASRTKWVSVELFLAVLRKMVMRSSINPSVQAVLHTGTLTAIFQAVVIGMSSGSEIGIGVTGWAGL
jgi:hypothetical protein